MKTRSQLSNHNPGAVHTDLLGGPGGYRFRSRRLPTDELSFEVSCLFRVDGKQVGPLRVVDVSPTGLAVEMEDHLLLTPGTVLEGLQITYRDSAVWEGEAIAVYQVEGHHPRAGLKFTTRLFDLHLLLLRDDLVENTLESELELQERYNRLLPQEWRAGVASIRQLFNGAKEVLEVAQSNLLEEPIQQRLDEEALFEKIFEKWGPPFHAQLRRMTELTANLDDDLIELARGYATREILPLVYSCPMYRHAYEKPLGYAGDFQLMRYFFAEEYSGETLYDRYLHFGAQRYPLSLAIRAREQTMREVVRQALAEYQPCRVVSLACGPAIELQNLLRELGRLQHPIELILIDQDEPTMYYCHDTLSRLVVAREKDGAGMIELNCLHLSIRQLVHPKDEAERSFLERVLKGVHLVYSAGLLDYLPDVVTRRLIESSYQMLAPGGRLFIGNMRRCPVSSWIMEFVLSWHLVYREPAVMLGFAQSLQPEPSEKATDFDATKGCVFVDVRRPAV